MTVYHVGHDKHVEACRTSGEVRKQRFDRVTPFVSLNVEGGGVRDLRGSQVGVVTHVLDEIRVRVVGHDSSAGAQDGRDDTGDTGGGADFEDILPLDEGAGPFFYVVGAGPAGVPEEVPLRMRAVIVWNR